MYQLPVIKQQKPQSWCHGKTMGCYHGIKTMGKPWWNPGKSWENHGKTLDSRWNGLDMTGWLFKLLKDDDATIHSHPFLSLLRSFTTMPLDAHKNQHGCACKSGFQGFIINNFPINLPCWGVFGIPYLQRPFTFHGKVPIHSIHVTHSKSHLQCSHFIPMTGSDRHSVEWPLCLGLAADKMPKLAVLVVLNRNKSYLVALCCCPMLTKQNKTILEHWHHS